MTIAPQKISAWTYIVGELISTTPDAIFQGGDMYSTELTAIRNFPDNSVLNCADLWPSGANQKISLENLDLPSY